MFTETVRIKQNRAENAKPSQFSRVFLEVPGGLRRDKEILKALIATGEKLSDVADDHRKATMRDFSNNRNAGIQIFVSNIETINEMSNRLVEVLFDKEEVHICA